MQTTRQITELSSGTLSYLQWGQGLPILCLHGLADHALVWQSLGDCLAEKFRVIAPDLPGHGDSFKPQASEAYLSTALVSTLEDFANVNQWHPISIIAHSWSAKLALMWARRNPRRIQHLILVDPFFVNRFPDLLKPTLPILYRVLPFLKMLGPFPSKQAAESMARSLKQYRGWSDLQRDVFLASIEQKSDGCWGSKFAIAARDGVFLDTFEQSGLTETLQVPTHILIPKAGLNRRNWQLRPYKKYLSQLILQHIPGNHWPHLVEPEAFNRTILEILKTSMA